MPYKTPDWIVDRLELTGSLVYPYRVHGHHREPYADRPDNTFVWRVPDIVNNRRYDLAHTQADSATWLHVAKDARKALIARIEADHE